MAPRRGTCFSSVKATARVGVTRGRIHFVSGARTRTSAWIFLEWTLRDVEERFHEFAASELWGLVEGIDD